MTRATRLTIALAAAATVTLSGCSADSKPSKPKASKERQWKKRTGTEWDRYSYEYRLGYLEMCLALFSGTDGRLFVSGRAWTATDCATTDDDSNATPENARFVDVPEKRPSPSGPLPEILGYGAGSEEACYSMYDRADTEVLSWGTDRTTLADCLDLADY